MRWKRHISGALLIIGALAAPVGAVEKARPDVGKRLDAVDEGVRRANKTLRNLSGARVVEQKVKIEKGKIVEYRIEMDITFILD